MFIFLFHKFLLLTSFFFHFVNNKPPVSSFISERLLLTVRQRERLQHFCGFRFGVEHYFLGLLGYQVDVILCETDVLWSDRNVESEHLHIILYYNTPKALYVINQLQNIYVQLFNSPICLSARIFFRFFFILILFSAMVSFQNVLFSVLFT